MSLACLAQILGGTLTIITGHSTAVLSVFASAAVTAADMLQGAPRADDWLGRISQSGLFAPHDQVRILSAELCLAVATASATTVNTGAFPYHP
eukprot:COSAG05_NODE_8653_length_683_cov_1.327055_1_plen_93_part_00